MIREEGQPIAPLPGQLAFRFMAEPRPGQRTERESGRRRRKDSRADAPGQRVMRWDIAGGGVRMPME
jgi:hypothetical protein